MGIEVSEVRDCDKSEQSQRVADPERIGSEGRQFPSAAIKIL